jgi:archaellum component FlaC
MNLTGVPFLFSHAYQVLFVADVLMLLSIIKPPCNIADINSKQDPNEPVKVGMLNEAVDAILEGMGRMVEGLENKMNSRFDKVENRLQSVETEVRFVKDEINGLKADISTTLSGGEFEELKTKVNKVLSN